jgi:hypothetical protein
MTPVGLIARVSRLAVGLLLLAGCASESVRLGDVEDAGGAPGIGAAGGSVAGAAGVDSTAGEGGSSGAACVSGSTEADEVLWIGDSWITLPGTQLSRLRELAQLAGAIGPNESYATRAIAAASIADVVDQYEAQQASGTPVKVLLMNGGTWDTLNGASVASVMVTFEQFLSKVASDGSVEHIVYFLQPELPTIAGVAELRPLLRTACEGSAVPCHFLDLNPIWQGHAEYTGPSGIQASEAGGVAIAEAIWDVMQNHCIAQ